MRRLGKWLLPVLGIGHLLLMRAGVLDARGAFLGGAALEVLLLLVAARQALLVRQVYRRGRAAGGDIWAALEDGLAVLMPRPAARVAVLEPKLWYCLARWLARRRTDTSEFGYQQRALIGPVLLLAALTLPVELLAIELLIPWTWLRILPAVAGLYSFLWLAGFYASLQVLPHRLETDRLRVRFGAFAEGIVPFESIAGIAVERRRTPGGRDGLRIASRQATAYLGTGGRTDITLRLAQPLVLLGLRGPTAPVMTLCFAADEPQIMARELASRAALDVTIRSTSAPARLWCAGRHSAVPRSPATA